MLSSLLLTYPQFDPVALQLGPLVIRWYALAYVTGILAGWGYIARLNKDGQLVPPAIPKGPLDDLVSWAVLSILIGGRLGYVLFYQPGYYLSHPLEILYVWQGGMSFHGGLLGVILGYLLFARKYNLVYFEVMDLLACAAPIGLFFGRLANFVNGELYGRIAPEAPFAMVFPHGGELPRHASQLYEAALEGLVLFFLLLLVARFTKARQRAGLISGLFLLGYGLARICVEPFREPDAQLGFLFAQVTMGQLLSAPMLAAGAALILRALKRPARLPGRE